MRRLPLAALLVGLVTSFGAAAEAGTVLGRPRFGVGVPVVVVPYAFPYPYAVHPGAVLPFPGRYAPSYFRPDAPYAWNAQRNWRDTWQDDGVKVHGYTLR